MPPQPPPQINSSAFEANSSNLQIGEKKKANNDEASSPVASSVEEVTSSSGQIEENEAAGKDITPEVSAAPFASSSSEIKEEKAVVQFENASDVSSATSSAPLTAQGESSSKYAAIAQLDEAAEDDSERWSERTSIITKLDHERYVDYARELVHDIVDAVKTPEKKNDSSSSR